MNVAVAKTEKDESGGAGPWVFVMRFGDASIDHICAQHDPALAAALFRRSVTMVEIEVFSYCNRRCSFCPNAIIDRRSLNQFMPAEMYTSILAQLASIDYAGMISFSRYNEPLANKVILERISEAHTLVPRAVLHANTNGDYLDRAYLDQLYAAGLRSLNIQVYLGNAEGYVHEKIKACSSRIIERLDLPQTLARDEPGVWYEHHLQYLDMQIRLYGRDFEQNGTSRGGLLAINQAYQRRLPCLVPFWSIYVDFNGSLLPCCNFRSDAPEHKNYVIGSLTEQPNLFLQYAGDFSSSFRRRLLHFDIKSGLCRNCHFSLKEPSDEEREVVSSLLATANRPGLTEPDVPAST